MNSSVIPDPLGEHLNIPDNVAEAGTDRIDR
jgi:hypothetical protein